MAIVKFTSNRDYQLFIDKEFVGNLSSSSMLKKCLEVGDYLVEIKDKEFNIVKRYNLEIKSTDNQVLQDVSVQSNSLDDVINQLRNDSTIVFHCDRASFCYDGKYGYINKKFEIVIPAIYSKANVFNDRKAFVVRIFPEGKKTTLIDCDGIMSFDRWYDYIGESDSAILLGLDNKIIVYSKTTYNIIAVYYNAGYDHIYPLVPVFKKDGIDDLYGFIDFEGKEVIPLLFDKVWNYNSDGIAKVYFIGRYYDIDNKSYLYVWQEKFQINSFKDLVDCTEWDFCSCENRYDLDDTIVTVRPKWDNDKWFLMKTISSRNDVILQETQIDCDKILFIGFGCYAYRIGTLSKVTYIQLKRPTISFIQSNNNEYTFNEQYIIPVNRPYYNGIVTIYYPSIYITKENGKYGIMNKYGEQLFPKIYDNITPTESGIYAIMQLNSKYGIANIIKGKILINFEYDHAVLMRCHEIDYVSERLFFLLRRANKYKIFCAEEKKLTDEYDEIIVCENKNIVKIADKYGIIDNYGEVILPIVNEFIIPIGNNSYYSNYFKIKKGDVYALGEIRTGSIISDFQFDDISELCTQRSFFLVKKDDKYGCINERGETIIPTRYDKIVTEFNNLLPWDDDSLWCVSLYENEQKVFFNLVLRQFVTSLPSHLL